MSFFEIIINPNADGRLVYYPGEILKGILKYVNKLLGKLTETYILRDCQVDPQRADNNSE